MVDFKYKVTDIAKDFGISTKKVIETFAELTGETRKTGATFEENEVNALLDEHIGHVAHRIRELRALEKDLKSLRARCASPHALADCGILNGLDRAAAAPAAPAKRRHVHGAH
mgnify:CR=1 FL=1